MLVAHHHDIHHNEIRLLQEIEGSDGDGQKKAQEKIAAYDVVLPSEDTHVRSEVAELVHNSGDGTRRSVLTTKSPDKFRALTCVKHCHALFSAAQSDPMTVICLSASTSYVHTLCCVTHQYCQAPY